VAFGATENVRFQQKAIGLQSILEGSLLLISDQYHDFQTG
jgi:hypothetical protein